MRYSIVAGLCLALLALAGRVSAGQITAAEYFFDADPGPGNGIPLSVTVGDSVSLFQALPVASLEPGVHRVGLRYQDSLGTWSVPIRRSFILDFPSTEVPITAARFRINQGEYLPLELDAGTDVAFSGLEFPGVLPAGLHRLAFQYQSQAGTWSSPVARPFRVLAPASPEPTHLEMAEMRICGTMDNGAVFDTTFFPTVELAPLDSSFESTLDTLFTGYLFAPGVIPRGNYIASVRYQDNLGNWLRTSSAGFTVTSGLVIRAAYPSANNVSLYWFESVQDAGTFYMYRGDSTDGVFSFVDSTSATSYVDTIPEGNDIRQFYRVTSHYWGPAIHLDAGRILPLDAAYVRED